MPRRHVREKYEPRDTRELTYVVGKGFMSCDDYKTLGCEPTMRWVDSLTPEWRAVVHDFGMAAWDYRKLPASEARVILERNQRRA